MPPLDVADIKTLSEIISAGVSSKLVYEGSVCDSYPCWNDGVCIENNATASGYLCMCAGRFTGTHCQSLVASNCSSIICETGSVCIQELSACLPLSNLTALPACDVNPCLNGGHCALIGVERLQRCLCPNLYHGVLCEVSSSFLSHLTTQPDTWSFLQSIILFAMAVLLAAGCLIFCYGGNTSCYLLLPDSRQRYSKWRDAASEDLAWDPEDDEDDVGPFTTTHSHSSASDAETGRRVSEVIELKSRPMKISTTSETFVSYDPTAVASDDAQRALLPSIS